MFSKVSRDQFEFQSDLKVRHRPTGATVSTHRYHDPAESCSTITVNYGLAEEYLSNGHEFSRKEIKVVACRLLRERAVQRP